MTHLPAVEDRLHEHVGMRMAFSPNERHLYVGGRCSLYRWTWPERRLDQDYGRLPERLCGLAVSPDGLRIATCGKENLLRIWNTVTKEPLLALEGHSGDVYDVAWTANQSLVTASSDRTARIWETAPLGQRVRARRAYRAFAAAQQTAIDALVARDGAITELPAWSSWTEREREIASQLRTRSLSRR